MTNVLTDALDEIYEDVETEMTGGYGPSLKGLLFSMLDNCECENPGSDIEVQIGGLIDDLELLKARLAEAVVERAVPTP